MTLVYNEDDAETPWQIVDDDLGVLFKFKTKQEAFQAFDLLMLWETEPN